MGTRILLFTDSEDLEDKEFRDMRSRVSEKDAETFPLDSPVMSQDYMDRCCLSFRRFILQETDETIPRARRRLER